MFNKKFSEMENIMCFSDYVSWAFNLCSEYAKAGDFKNAMQLADIIKKEVSNHSLKIREQFNL
jgi:hypothetical protein